MKLRLPLFFAGIFLTALPSAGAELSQKQLFEDLVAPVLSAKCVSCHGAEKQKGKLRVDTLDAILKGGYEGASVVAGEQDESPLLQRVYLPLDDDEHMPPEGKDQLSAEETAVLAFWIDSGANAGISIADLNPDEATQSAIATVIGSLSNAPVMVAEQETAPALNEAQLAIIEETIGRVSETGASLMPIAQDTPELRFSALNVAKEFSDQDLTQLQPVAGQMKWIDLARTQITDEGLSHLETMENVTRLHLENTNITDSGLKHLSGLKKLEYLNLYGTAISDAGVAHLAGLKNLKKVFLWQSKVTDVGARKLAAAIPGLEANTGWKASQVEPVALKTEPEKKPATQASAPAPKPQAKPAPKPTEPKPAPAPKKEPAPAETLFTKAIAELKTASTAASEEAAKAKKDFDAAIQEVDAATKKAQALKERSEKAALVAKEAKAALDQLLKASEAEKK